MRAKIAASLVLFVVTLSYSAPASTRENPCDDCGSWRASAALVFFGTLDRHDYGGGGLISLDYGFRPWISLGASLYLGGNQYQVPVVGGLNDDVKAEATDVFGLLRLKFYFSIFSVGLHLGGGAALANTDEVPLGGGLWNEDTDSASKRIGLFLFGGSLMFDISIVSFGFTYICAVRVEDYDRLYAEPGRRGDEETRLQHRFSLVLEIAFWGDFKQRK